MAHCTLCLHCARSCGYHCYWPLLSSALSSLSKIGNKDHHVLFSRTLHVQDIGRFRLSFGVISRLLRELAVHNAGAFQKAFASICTLCFNDFACRSAVIG